MQLLAAALMTFWYVAWFSVEKPVVPTELFP
jgi:hypothetical protein